MNCPYGLCLCEYQNFNWSCVCVSIKTLIEAVLSNKFDLLGHPLVIKITRWFYSLGEGFSSSLSRLGGKVGGFRPVYGTDPQCWWSRHRPQSKRIERLSRLWKSGSGLEIWQIANTRLLLKFPILVRQTRKVIVWSLAKQSLFSQKKNRTYQRTSKLN